MILIPSGNGVGAALDLLSGATISAGGNRGVQVWSHLNIPFLREVGERYLPRQFDEQCCRENCFFRTPTIGDSMRRLDEGSPPIETITAEAASIRPRR